MLKTEAPQMLTESLTEDGHAHPSLASLVGWGAS